MVLSALCVRCTIRICGTVGFRVRAPRVRGEDGLEEMLFDVFVLYSFDGCYAGVYKGI